MYHEGDGVHRDDVVYRGDGDCGEYGVHGGDNVCESDDSGDGGSNGTSVSSDNWQKH